MNTLRTPKTRSGPELGNPAIGFRAWYEGLHGKEAFEAIGRIARTDWAAYLDWFQKQVDVPIRYETRLIGLEPTEDGYLQLRLRSGDGETTEVVRKVIFANGVEGSGGPFLPKVFDGIFAGRYAHTGDGIDFSALAGKSVGILGAATSALDAAATALETRRGRGAPVSYRSELAVAGPGGNAQNPGAQENFHFLSDATRWKQRWNASSKGSASPRDSVLRAVGLHNLFLHFKAPWNALHEQGSKVVVDAGDGRHSFDFVIAGTGYHYDPSTRPELAGIAEQIALWKDVYEPPAELRSNIAGLTPYLGHGYELTERVRGSAPWLANIHLFNAAAGQSFGRPVGDIPSLRTGVPRLVAAVARDLHLADLKLPKTSGAAAAEADDFAAQYAHAIWREKVRVADPA